MALLYVLRKLKKARVAMTENEAKKVLERDLQIQIENGALPDGIEALTVAIQALEEVQQYRQIGTVELCQMAVRKQTARRALHQGCYDKNGTWHEWNGVNGKPYELCPSCGANLCCEMSNDKKPEYCVDCGQKLYWGDGDDGKND